MNRHGFVGDAAYVVAVLFAVALVVVIGIKLFDSWNVAYQDTDASVEAKAISQELNDRYASLWDGIFMLVFGMFAIAMVVSVAALGTSPEFFFITIIVGFFILGGAAALSNTFLDATNTPELSSSASQLTFIPLVMNNLAEVALFLLALLLVGLFVKARGII